MTQAYQRREAVSETVSLAFKRHILEKSSGFASEPMADAFRVNLLSGMLDRYDELIGKGMSEQAAMQRTMHEFDDIAAQMRDMGFDKMQESAVNSRWPQLSDDEARRYIQERDAYLHRTAIGTAMCTACVTPLMIGAALSEIWYVDAFSMLGLVGMFVLIGMGVYTITTAVKPKGEKRVKKGRFALAAGLRRRLAQLREAIEAKARKRRGMGVALCVMSIIPVFIGAMLQEMFYTDAWPILGVAGMFLMIGAGVYELIMADGEKTTMKRLLGGEKEE